MADLTVPVVRAAVVRQALYGPALETMGAGGSIAFRTYLCPVRRKRANPDPEISEDRSHGDTRDLEPSGVGHRATDLS